VAPARAGRCGRAFASAAGRRLATAWRALPIVLLCGFAAPALAECAPDRADIRGPWGQARFTVEIADDAKERAQGLMFRQDLAPMAGMLFVYESPVRAVFWMKNTPLPLDMIFLDPSGTVSRVIANAEPFSLDRRDGGPGIQYVLEIHGGLAGRLGIGPGSELRHPAIAPGTAAWPCD
jgi:uncharacterized membrane protein (UPF0127 family)